MSPQAFLSLAQVFPEALFMVTGDGEVRAANHAAGRLLGLSPQALPGQTLAELVVTPPERLAQNLRAWSRTRTVLPDTLTFRGADGQPIVCRAEGALLVPRTAQAPALLLVRCQLKPLANQPCIALSEKIHELTQANRRLTQAHEALHEQRERLEVTLSSIGDAVIATDTQGQVVFMNPVAEALTGWRKEQASGKNIAEIFQIINEETRKIVENPVAKIIHEGRVVGLADHTILIARDGAERPIHDSGAPIWDRHGRLLGVVLIFRDITERVRAERQLLASLREKEVLLREIHHRVKNNMQVVSSLLNLQADALADPQMRTLLEESQSRIHAMALIHEQLYQSDELARIDLTQYLHRLCGALFGSYRIDPQQITLRLDTEPLSVVIDTAIPCGLIMHELLSNCLKHAFPDGRSGEIHIVLRQDPPSTCCLTVRDNGVGIPPGLDFHTTHSLGWQLVYLLTEQLGGTLTLERHEGTIVTLTFPITRAR